MTPAERVKRIQEITAKGAKATEAEKTEVRRLITEQMEWERKNPSEAAAMRSAMAIAAKTPEEMKAEYEAAQAAIAAKGVKFDPEASASFRDTAAAAGTPESLLPKPVTPPSKFTPEMEDARTKYGMAVRARALAAGKSSVVAAAEALDAYRSWYPEMKDSGVMPEAAPDPSIEYPMAEAPKIEYDANGWYFDEATGKWIPGPDAVYKKEEAKPAEAPAAPAPEPEAAKDEPTMEPVPANPEAPKEKPTFRDRAKELYTKYGVPVLEILESVGKQRGGIDKPTMLDKKYAEKLATQEREYAKKLEEDRLTREEAAYAKRMADQRAWEEAQEKARQAFESGQSATGYTQQEKLLRMQLEAQKAAARAGGGTSAPIIPD